MINLQEIGINSGNEGERDARRLIASVRDISCFDGLQIKVE